MTINTLPLGLLNSRAPAASRARSALLNGRVGLVIPVGMEREGLHASQAQDGAL
jgi:hypothetical protein